MTEICRRYFVTLRDCLGNGLLNKMPMNNPNARDSLGLREKTRMTRRKTKNKILDTVWRLIAKSLISFLDSPKLRNMLIVIDCSRLVLYLTEIISIPTESA